MVQFKILSGNRAGTVQVADHFPLLVGRSPSAGIRLDDAGVWDSHLKLELDSSGSFILKLQANAIATVNGQSFEQIALRNGDLIELGSAKIQFWLSETSQRSVKMREYFMWTAIALLTLLQAALILCLLK